MLQKIISFISGFIDLCEDPDKGVTRRDIKFGLWALIVVVIFWVFLFIFHASG